LVHSAVSVSRLSPLFLPVTLVVVALALGACGQREEPVEALPQPYPVTVQGAGEVPTAVTARPERIVALDSGPARLLAALDIGDRVVGVPADVQPGRRNGIVVDKSGQVDVDEVARLRPDLIVSTPAVDPLDVSRAQRRSDAALYVQPDSSVDDVVRGTLDLGFLVGEPINARRLAERIRRDTQSVEARVAGEPIVSTFVDTGFFITIPGRTLLCDLIRRAGGESIAGDAPAPEAFPVTRLRRLDPDMYLATTESRITLRQLRADPRTASLTAVQEGRFAILPSELVNEAGPRVAAALERVARALHPDAFR
jgi:iron complex transport system substrate-binding protein